MPWNVAICDDDPQLCRLISQYMQQFQQDTGESITCMVFYSAEELLASQIDHIDLFLLDIAMGGMTGITAARQLRSRGNHSLLVFITSMTQFALEGYEVHAFGFLRKPLAYAAFQQVMTDAMQVLHRTRGYQLEVRCGATTQMLDTAEILYVESFGHNITLRQKHGQALQCSIPLSDLEAKLGPGFFRCHKSYLVNLMQITRIETDSILLCDGTTLPVSKYRRKDFLVAFARQREGMV